MAITYVDRVTGTNTATLPTHQINDVIVAFAFRDGNTTAPTIGNSGDWNNITSAGANTCSYRIAYKICDTTSETTGTWTNATGVVFQIYRGCDLTDPIGVTGTNSNTNGTANYPALGTFNRTDNTSWGVAFGGSRSIDTNMQNAPSGMTARSTFVDATNEVAGFDTNGTISSWSSQNVTLSGTNSGWRTAVIELKAAPEQMVGTTSLTFTTTGTMNGSTSLTGSTSLAFTTTGVLTGRADLVGNTSLTFTINNATGQLIADLVGSTSLNFALTGTLTTVPIPSGDIYQNSTGEGNLIYRLSNTPGISIFQSSSGSNGNPYGESS